MAGKAVLHMQKSKSSGGGSLGAHIDREPGKEYSYRHADLSRTKDNIFIEVNPLCKVPYNQAIQNRITQGYNHRNKAGELKVIRKDAVTSVNTILSGSHEAMLRIAKNQQLLQMWILANLEFCKKEYGEDNITRFVVHMDEKTPHIHCAFVPITPDGRLNAGHWMKTGKHLEEIQDRYAEAMKGFGLERGVKSDRKHHTTDDYRRRETYKLEDNKEIFKDLAELKQTDVFGFKNKKEAISAKLENLILNQEESTKKEIEGLKSKISGLEEHISEFARKENDIPKSNFIPNAEIKEILENVTAKEYFFDLMERGKINFVKKSGGEFYFSGTNTKIAVSEKGYFDFNSNTGGQVIKAVMQMEGLPWKDAVNYLKHLSRKDFSHLKFKEEMKGLSNDTSNLTALMRPNNQSLLLFFEGRGISREVLKEYTKQLHYQIGEKHYFGLSLCDRDGFKNKSGGYEVRSTTGKIKIGPSNFIELGNKNSDKTIVFEGMTDLLSYIESEKDRGVTQIKERLVCLNSVTNAPKFIEEFQNHQGKIFLCLDADEAGEKATQQIMAVIPKAEDIREVYGIYQGRGGAEDLNERLQIDKGLIRENNRGMRY